VLSSEAAEEFSEFCNFNILFRDDVILAQRDYLFCDRKKVTLLPERPYITFNELNIVFTDLDKVCLYGAAIIIAGRSFD